MRRFSQAQILMERLDILLREDDWERDQPLDASSKGPFYPSRNTNQFYQGGQIKGMSPGKLPSDVPLSVPASEPAAKSAPPSSQTNTGAIGSHVRELRKSLEYN